MLWAVAAAAFLIGSIPFGVIVAKVYGVDLRASGSGNIGATNALRVIGKKAGALTLAGDMLKGVLAVYAASRISGWDAGLVAAAAAVIGHDFSVFTGFRGGKGVATTFGVVLALDPVVALLALAAWAVPVALWRYSSLGALTSAGMLPVIALALRGDDTGFVAVTFFLTGLAVFKHRANIVRLVRGEEPKVGAKAG